MGIILKYVIIVKIRSFVVRNHFSCRSFCPNSIDQKLHVDGTSEESFFPMDKTKKKKSSKSGKIYRKRDFRKLVLTLSAMVLKS